MADDEGNNGRFEYCDKKRYSWITKLKRLNPCSDALKWAKQFPTLQAAWDACERGDRLLWLAALVGLTPERHKLLVVATCRIVERWLYLVPVDEPAPRNAVETALRWTEGLATLKEVHRAANAVWAAWATEAAETAEAAARAVGVAARAVEAAAWAAEAAAESAESAESAEAAWAEESKAQAEIVRQYLTCPNWSELCGTS